MDALQQDSRSVGDLIGELARETSTLVRQEVHLASVEMSQKITYGAKQAALVAGGGLVGIVAFQTLVGAVVLALGLALPLWAAALIVGAVVGAVAGIIFWKGYKSLRALDLQPRQTFLSIEDTKSWARQQLQ